MLTSGTVLGGVPNSQLVPLHHVDDLAGDGGSARGGEGRDGLLMAANLGPQLSVMYFLLARLFYDPVVMFYCKLSWTFLN